MLLALSTFLYFISPMRSVNGAQFLNITFLFALFTATASAAFATVIVPLTSIYPSL